jgi:hypothetical protein
MMRKLLLFAGISFAVTGCMDSNMVEPNKTQSDQKIVSPAAAAKPTPAPVTYLTGDGADVSTNAIGGLLLMGVAPTSMQRSPGFFSGQQVGMWS